MIDELRQLGSVYTDGIGYIAALLTTLAFIPQTWLVWRTKDVEGVSLSMYGIFTLGVGLWLMYGWLVLSWPIIISNTITWGLAISILTMKIRYSRVPHGHQATQATAMLRSNI